MITLTPLQEICCPHCSQAFPLQEGLANHTITALAEKAQREEELLREKLRKEEKIRLEAANQEEVKRLEQQLQDLAQQRKNDGQLADRLREEAIQAEKQRAEREAQSLRKQLQEEGQRANELLQKIEQANRREAELQLREAQIEHAIQQKAGELAKHLASAEADRVREQVQRAQSAAMEKLVQELADIKEQIIERDKKIDALREQEKVLLGEKRSIKEQMEALELESARKLDSERDAIAAKVRQIEKEKHDLEMAEQLKKFNDVHAKLEEAKRKAEQGSQQTQGEVLENVLEDLLRSAFPLDRIDEVKKGARGADVKQTVMSNKGQSAGVILWEAKRAAHWSNDWIPKLKEDQMNAGAELAVIVTTAMPKELEGQPHGHLDDVFVCSPYAMRALAVTLRIALLEASRQKVMSAGRQEKADAVFSYVTSPQFAQRVRKIDDFMQSQLESLNKERRALTQIWKSREQEILSAQETLLNVAGEIRGIAQQTLPDLVMEVLSVDDLMPAPVSG